MLEFCHPSSHHHLWHCKVEGVVEEVEHVEEAEILREETTEEIVVEIVAEEECSSLWRRRRSQQ